METQSAFLPAFVLNHHGDDPRTHLTLRVGDVKFTDVQVRGREFSAATIARIEGILRADPSLSRHALSLRVCEWLE